MQFNPEHYPESEGTGMPEVSLDSHVLTLDTDWAPDSDIERLGNQIRELTKSEQ